MCLLNLLLTFGVIRRLREHTEALAKPARPAVSRPGRPVGEFSSAGLSAASLGERALVGFFAVGCRPCEESLPKFAALAAGAPTPVVAVVATMAELEDSSAYVSALESVATVVIERPDGPIATAFGVSGFPTFALVSRGVVEAVGSDPAAVAALV
ncbi:TlpA family protein disulfide reductase [Nonomuraea sp. NPDC003214]